MKETVEFVSPDHLVDLNILSIPVDWNFDYIEAEKRTDYPDQNTDVSLYSNNSWGYLRLM